MARPERFERPTLRFVVCLCRFSQISVVYSDLLKMLLKSQFALLRSSIDIHQFL